MENIKIIFILHNIYESTNGVSNKYIKFINYLLTLSSYNIILITTFKKREVYEKMYNKISPKFNIIKTHGLSVPNYKEIKIPIIKESLLLEHIKDGNEIIVFNGEFIWIYDILKNIKNRYKKIKLYPTMHTDYVFYYEKIYTKFNFNLLSILNYLDNNLENKIFNGIIVTGEKMKEKYKKLTDNVFNANEVNLDIFNNVKKDTYNSSIYNIIYCGRIAKEKNIEELLECCNKLTVKYILHIIGDGPYMDNLKDIIHIKYKKMELDTIFYGNKDAEDINNIYQLLTNRIFIFTSISETFGKTPMEAGATGMPIFIKKSDITEYLYINKKNAFIFDDSNSFIDLFNYFIKLSEFEKQIFISESVNNIKKYDQNKIFEEYANFIIDHQLIKNKVKLNIFDVLTFNGISQFINCTGNILGD